MNKLPLLPLRDIVIFPDMIVPLFVGREKSVLAIEEVMKNDNDDKKILLLTQKDPLTDNPSRNDVYKVGVLANILQMLKLPDGTVKVLVEGLKRVKVSEVTDIKFLTANFGITLVVVRSQLDCSYCCYFQNVCTTCLEIQDFSTLCGF